MSPQQFEQAARGLAIQHNGRFWMIGAETGRWFVSDGSNWVQATPPDAGSAAPAPATAAPAAAAAGRSGFGETAGKWGLLLLIMGAGSFVLPMFGLQFRLFSLYGNEAGAGVVAIVVGGVLLLVSLLGGRKSASAPTNQLPGGGAQGRQAGLAGGGSRVGWLIAAAVVAAGLFVWWSNRSPSPSRTAATRPPAVHCPKRYFTSTGRQLSSDQLPKPPDCRLPAGGMVSAGNTALRREPEPAGLSPAGERQALAISQVQYPQPSAGSLVPVELQPPGIALAPCLDAANATCSINHRKT